MSELCTRLFATQNYAEETVYLVYIDVCYMHCNTDCL